MMLSARKGNLVLDMSCDVYFTNPTDVEWSVTRVDVEAYILKNKYTKELTPDFTKEILTGKVSAHSTGHMRLNFHNVLPHQWSP